MTEQTPAHDPGPVPPADETKHRTEVRSADGCIVGMTRGAAEGMVALTITREQGGVHLTAWLRPVQLAALLHQAGDPRCATCHFSRYDARNELRCHFNTPRKRGDETFFPRVATGDWCRHYKAPDFELARRMQRGAVPL